MADDPGLALNARRSNEIKGSLKEWIGFVQGVVEDLCEVKRVSTGPEKKHAQAMTDDRFGIVFAFPVPV